MSDAQHHTNALRWPVTTFVVVFVLVGLAAESGLAGLVAALLAGAAVALALRARRPRGTG